MLAVVLPELAVELAEAQLELEQCMSCAASGAAPARAPRVVSTPVPVAVVLAVDSDHRAPERLHADNLEATGLERRLHGVNGPAALVGLYRGQTIASALTTVHGLVIFEVAVPTVIEALIGGSDLLRRQGGLVSYEAPDTIWLELAPRDHGAGEASLAEEVLRSFAALGHRASVAVADGPWLARAFAGFGELDRTGARVVSSTATDEALLALPVIALPLSAGARLELARQGLLTIADLRSMRSSALVEGLLQPDEPRARRGRQRHARAAPEPFPMRRRSPRELLELVRGRDRTVLEPQPPATLREAALWPRATSSAAALDLVLARLCARVSARLMGRAEAAVELALLVRASDSSEPRRLTLRPRVPAWSSDELLALARARLQDIVQGKGCSGLALEVARVALARAPQGLLAFAGPSAQPGDETVVRALLHEIEQRWGAARLGFACSRRRRGGATSVDEQQRLPVLSSPSGSAWSAGVPTRWLSTPLPITGSLSKDQIVVLESQAYVIRARHFEGRSTTSGEPRDYFRLWLAALDEDVLDGGTAGGARRGVEVLVYRDRHGAHLQAFFD